MGPQPPSRNDISPDEPSGHGAPHDRSPHDLLFELRLAQMGRRERDYKGRRHLWLTHHWPDDYPQRCARIGSRHVCRRCSALYPMGFLVAFLAAAGYPLWPTSWDPIAIWILCLPATVAYVGEAIGLFGYSPRWQVGAMLITATAFGRGLGYELTQRWSPEFWQPVVVFGGIWFLATVFGLQTSRSGISTSPTSSTDSDSVREEVGAVSNVGESR